MNQARRAPTMTIITNIAIEFRKARQRQTLNRSIGMKLVFDSKKIEKGWSQIKSEKELN